MDTTPSKRPVEPADLFRLKFIVGGALSPDGKYAAYVQSHVDPDKDKQYSAIWLADLTTGETRQLTSGSAVDASPAWSPDSQSIAFMSTRSEKGQLYVIPIDGGEAKQLTTFKQGIGGAPLWSPDGKYIAFTAVPIEEPRDQSKPYRVKRHIYRFNGMEYLDDVVQDMYVIAAGGGEARQLTKDETTNAPLQWSPDSKELLYFAMMATDSHRSLFPTLRAVDLVSGAIRDVIGGSWGSISSASWTADGSRIVFMGTPAGKKIGSKADVWVMPAAGGEPENRTPSLEVGVNGGLEPDMPVLVFLQKVIIDSQGQAAYVPVQTGGLIHIYKVALSGPESAVPVVAGERSVEMLAGDDRHLLYFVSDFNQPTDLFVSNLDGSDEKQLTCINDEFLAGLQLPNVKQLLFPGVDGTQVEGWIWMPSNEPAPYPTILLIHGGPHGAWGHIFNFNAQMLVGAGFAVIQVNHRASIGYGDKFSTAIKGDWGNLDYNDLMAGVDYAIAQGYSDPDKLGVCGLSGGGNLSCWIVGHTDRFKAAVPENPVTNWVSFYGVSDIGVWFGVEQMGGHPHEIPETYAKCSPITYAHKCKTPTLLVQAEHDWRCPPEQSEQFYTVLKANGCTAEMLRMPNEPHGGAIIGSIPTRRAHNDALLDWMNRYVLGKQAK